MDILLEISENDFSTGLSRVCTSFFSVRFEVRLCRAKKISRGRGDRSIRSLGSDDGAENRIHPLSRRRRRESSRRDSRPGSPKVASSLPRTHTQLSLSLSLSASLHALAKEVRPHKPIDGGFIRRPTRKLAQKSRNPTTVFYNVFLWYMRAPPPTHPPILPHVLLARSLAGQAPSLPFRQAPPLGSARLGSVRWSPKDHGHRQSTALLRPRPPPPPHPLFPKTSPSQKVIKADSPCPSRQSPG